tara:strand:+ start:170 stop:508 length:339 start_codon:yes stop_codon:yes gene_type:complete
MNEDDKIIVDIGDTFTWTSTKNSTPISIGDISYNFDPSYSGPDTLTVSTALDDTMDDFVYTLPNLENELSIDILQVEDMCKQYPALTKVWEQFKSFYDLCIDDYKTKNSEDM